MGRPFPALACFIVAVGMVASLARRSGKTAKALGIAIAQSLLLRADEVIE
jgi:hypothetical protein